MTICRLLISGLWLLPLAALGQHAGTLTLLEGSLRLVRGAEMHTVAEGLRLQEGDILQSAAKSLAQLEFSDGAIVVLGPETHAMILASPEAAAGAEIALASGWLKGEPRKAGTGDSRYLSTGLGVSTRGGTLVLRVGEQGTEAFIESGTAKIGEIGSRGELGATRAYKGGQFASRAPGQAVATQNRPPPGFVGAMPRAFRDTLPSRVERFKSRATEPRLEGDVSYADVAPWLQAPRNWRRGMVKRFRPRLKDPEFRAALDANMKSHWEWDRVLHPEKYRPKEPAAASDRKP